MSESSWSTLKGSAKAWAFLFHSKGAAWRRILDRATSPDDQSLIKGEVVDHRVDGCDRQILRLQLSINKGICYWWAADSGEDIHNWDSVAIFITRGMASKPSTTRFDSTCSRIAELLSSGYKLCYFTLQLCWQTQSIVHQLHFWGRHQAVPC